MEGFKQMNRTKEVDKVDRLLNQLPEPLRNLWENKIDDLSEEEQIAKLEEVIALRKQPVKSRNEEEHMLLPNGIEIFDSFPDDVREMIKEIRESHSRIEVGYGKAGHVLATPSQPGVCYKIMLAEEEVPVGTNDVARETELQSEMCEAMDGYSGVRVPKVYAFIHEPGTRAITMELLDASSIRKITDGRAELPANFNIEKFFKALGEFMEEMHRRGYHHRDLHWGNVLVDNKTGMPCVIDYGLSVSDRYDESEAYKGEYVKNGQMKVVVLQSDKESLKELRKNVEDHLVRKGV